MDKLVEFIKFKYPGLVDKLEIWEEDKSASLCLDPRGESRRTGRMQWGLQIQAFSSKILFNVASSGDLITFNFDTFRITFDKNYETYESNNKEEDRIYIFDMDVFSQTACTMIDQALESETGRAKLSTH